MNDNMRLYLITRTDEVNYGCGEYDAMVVRAKNKESALNIAHQMADEYNKPEGYTFRPDNTIVKYLGDEGVEEIILVSFVGD